MGIMDQIRFWCGILPKNARARLDELERRCIEVVDNGGIDPPIVFKNNLPGMAAWWGIPLHIFIFEIFDKEEITPRVVQNISKRISKILQLDLNLDPDNRELGYGAVSDAMDQFVFDTCRLWEAIFREHFKEIPDADYKQTLEYIKMIFTDPQLALADKLWLYFETEDELANMRESWEEGDDEIVDYLDDFSDKITRFYYLCTKKPFWNQG